MGQSCIDATLTRDIPGGLLQDWHVNLTYNGSSHHTIRFSFALDFEYVPSSRPWARMDWGLFYQFLEDQQFYVPLSMTDKKLDKLVCKLYRAINEALNHTCPLTPGHFRGKNNTWFTFALGWTDSTADSPTHLPATLPDLRQLSTDTIVNAADVSKGPGDITWPGLRTPLLPVPFCAAFTVPGRPDLHVPSP